MTTMTLSQSAQDAINLALSQTGFRAGFKAGPDGKPKLPVALIFACLVVVYVGFRYYWR